MLLSVSGGCIVTVIFDFVLCVLSVVFRPAVLAAYSNKRNGVMYSRGVGRLLEWKLVEYFGVFLQGLGPPALPHNCLEWFHMKEPWIVTHVSFHETPLQVGDSVHSWI